MKYFVIRDNSPKPKDEFRQHVSEVTKRIADRTLEQLKKDGIFVFPEQFKDTDDLSGKQMVLQSQNNDYRSGNIMGFIGYGEERLIIRSRFCGENENDWFFQYMLSRVMDMPNIFDLHADADSDTQLFNLLVFLFPYYLKTAMRKGVFRAYIRREYNDSSVRGTIDIARHISKNTPFVGNVAYNRREYSKDNPLIELVRHTIEFIKAQPYGQNILRSVKDEVNTVLESTPGYRPQDRRRIIAANRSRPVAHAYYHEYRTLQRLCLLILQREMHRIGAGERQVYGILFDGAWLWEEYIAGLVGDLFYHPRNRAKDGEQWLFSTDDRKKRGKIFPDFISCDRDNRIIADAKYKPIKNIGNKDYLQLLAYMFRFDAGTGFYFYPEENKGSDQRLWMNRGTTYEGNVAPRDDILVIKHGLVVPDQADDYDSFVECIKTAEQDFVNAITEIING